MKTRVSGEPRCVSVVQFDHGAVTEGRAKPDFLFPSAASYHDDDFPATRLSMLGAKTSCKDRWRQVLNEAARITRKHLLTLQPTISSYQMQEMREAELKLVVPAQLHEGYSLGQREKLLSLSEFIARQGFEPLIVVAEGQSLLMFGPA